MITGLAHVCLKVRDLDATLRFYCDVLGCTKVFDFLHEGALYGYYLQVAPGQFLEVFRAEETPGIAGPVAHLCFETGDIRAAAARLAEHGVATTEVTRGADGTWQCWFRDPDGVDVELHQYTAESCQRTGAPCTVDWL